MSATAHQHLIVPELLCHVAHTGVCANIGAVLDFTVSMHGEDELEVAHRRVVNAFRANRTVSVVGEKAWKRLNIKVLAARQWNALDD